MTETPLTAHFLPFEPFDFAHGVAVPRIPLASSLEEVRPEPPPLHTILKTPATKRRMRNLAVGARGGMASTASHERNSFSRVWWRMERMRKEKITQRAERASIITNF